jgi:hypothetical protein
LIQVWHRTERKLSLAYCPADRQELRTLNLLVVTVLSENVPQNTNSACSAKSSSPAYLCRKYSLFIEWAVVVVLSLEIQIGVGGLVAQRAIRSPANIYAHEGEVTLTFSLHGEMNALVDVL